MITFITLVILVVCCFTRGELFSESCWEGGEDEMAGEAGGYFVSFLLSKQEELNWLRQ